MPTRDHKSNPCPIRGLTTVTWPPYGGSRIGQQSQKPTAVSPCSFCLETEVRSLSTSHLPFFRNRFRLSALTNDQCGVNLTSSLFFPLGSLCRRCLRGSSSHDGVLLPLFLLRTTAVPELPAVRFSRLFLGGPICGDVNQKSNSWNRWMSRGTDDLSRCPSRTPFGMDTKSRKGSHASFNADEYGHESCPVRRNPSEYGRDRMALWSRSIRRRGVGSV